MISTAGTWMAHPRLAEAVAAVADSPTARAVLDEGAGRWTRLSFEAPPQSVTEFAARGSTIASYRPASNEMQMGFDVGLPGGAAVVTTADGTKVSFTTGRTAVEDGLALVHETRHRNQNKLGAMLARMLVVNPAAAPLAGVRELVTNRSVGESAGDAFRRGFDRTMLKVEVDAFHVEDRAAWELGQTASFHAVDGTYAGDEKVLAAIRPAYAATSLGNWRVGAGAQVSMAAAVGVSAIDD